MCAQRRGLSAGRGRVVQDRGGVGGGFGVVRQARQIRLGGARRLEHIERPTMVHQT